MGNVDLDSFRLELSSRLPRHTRWTLGETPLEFDFTRALAPLEPVALLGLVGREVAAEWRALRLFGEQRYGSGGGASPLLGIHEENGEIWALDAESDAPLIFVNSDQRCFIESFLVLDRALPARPSAMDQLAAKLAEIDPAGFERSDWRLLLAYLRGLER